MCVQYVQKQPPEVVFKKGVLENFANFTGKNLCWCFSVKLAKFLRALNFEEHLRTNADQMICNKILLQKIRAVFRISIKFCLNVRKIDWEKIRFQLALNKPYSLTPPPLIHRRFKHRKRTKINKAKKQCFSQSKKAMHPALYNKYNLYLSLRYWNARISESVARSCSVNEVFLKILQNSQVFSLAQEFPVNFAAF